MEFTAILMQLSDSMIEDMRRALAGEQYRRRQLDREREARHPSETPTAPAQP